MQISRQGFKKKGEATLKVHPYWSHLLEPTTISNMSPQCAKQCEETKYHTKHTRSDTY